MTLDYDEVPSLRLEARQKLKEFRPVSVGQASRISGVSPADISVYWYIWNIIKQQSRILRRNTWQIIIQNNLKKTVKRWV